ncbi:cyclic pyranopterin monophosphate synthase MoaC [Salinarchaeum sp. IM2453]|uniref:cyclic pyranopterin monophosphate synthase MoaC n=1 Tax=Salinarchaeum sp. IM2453 TaxID=2862870 RepID=UPI001C82C628|nr:cyclic pyranopterin monophosphate synthase MoaC [Salinarchaeum sp. IM2453]QZA87949.1 cyclic pyranopterin monophosphate synthase MoaC [Salinarchaeum sp. IM2453]
MSEDSDLTHTDPDGSVDMVDVGDKPAVNRRAVAEGTIHLQAETVAAINDTDVSKGDVIATARIGAIQAVKRTWDTIPMCHQIPITNINTSFDIANEKITLMVTVETTAQTGCEMEALNGVTTGLNVIWDMVKSAEKNRDGQYPTTRITDVKVTSKQKGGK